LEEFAIVDYQYHPLQTMKLLDEAKSIDSGKVQDTKNQIMELIISKEAQQSLAQHKMMTSKNFMESSTLKRKSMKKNGG
jgi:hypothetical protein